MSEQEAISFEQYLNMREVQENPSLLEGKKFDNCILCADHRDSAVYTIHNAWKEQDGKIHIDYSAKMFGRSKIQPLYKNKVAEELKGLLKCIEITEKVLV